MNKKRHITCGLRSVALFLPDPQNADAQKGNRRIAAFRYHLRKIKNSK